MPAAMNWETLYKLGKESCDELRQDDLSITAALTASLALYHLHEWLAATPGTAASSTGTVYKDDINSRFPDFDILRQLVNHTKHFKKTVVGPETANAGWGKLPWGEFRWGGGEQLVVTVEGQARGVVPLIFRVEKFWEEELARLGLTANSGG